MGLQVPNYCHRTNVDKHTDTWTWRTSQSAAVIGQKLHARPQTGDPWAFPGQEPQASTVSTRGWESSLWDGLGGKILGN